MLRLFLRALLIVSLIGSLLLGQQSQNAQIPVTLGAFQDPYLKTADVISSPSDQATSTDLVTRTIDLRETIQKFAAASEISMKQARLETLMQLGLAPAAIGGQPRAHATYERVEVDVLRVTAPAAFFRALPATKDYLELGRKHVVVCVQTFSISPDESAQIHRLIESGTSRIHTARILPVVPVATSDTNVVDSDSYVLTSTVTRQNIPVTTGHLTSENEARLLMYLRQSKTASLLSNPILSALPGQTASVNDFSYQPFVVGLKSVAGENGRLANEPVVQAIENGTTVRVKAKPNGDQIRLMTDIAISKVTGVELYRYPGPDEAIIQIPKQIVRQVHLSSLVEPGSTLLVDPNFVQEVEEKDGRGRVSRVKRKFLVTLRAELIASEAGENRIATFR